GDMRRMQRMITKSVRLVLVSSLLIAFTLITFRDFFLGLFGSEFTQGGAVLTILSIGLVVNAATGSVGTLLIMTNHERDVVLGLAIGALTNIILCFALIPGWGAEGAAIATAVSTGLWNILLAVFVYRRLGIHATALGSFGFRRSV
ncbi:MAG: polysaccharide biosynthesis C-terminal domain-containing protein, partial [Rubrobacteraceae bacterium]